MQFYSFTIVKGPWAPQLPIMAIPNTDNSYSRIIGWTKQKCGFDKEKHVDDMNVRCTRVQHRVPKHYLPSGASCY